jgi:hypothetical protein
VVFSYRVKDFKTMADFFINYAQPERPLAQKLADWLKHQGYTAWWDFELVPGEDFGTTIRRQIETAQAVITIWSERAARSQWVIAELQLSVDRGLRLTPLRADDTELPVPFNFYQATRINNWDEDLDKHRKIFALDRQRRDGQVTDAKEWENIKDRHDVDALELFLRKFRDTPYGKLAQERLATLKWERLRTSDDANALAEFAGEFSDTAAAEHARKRILLLQNRQPAGAVVKTMPVKPQSISQRTIRFLSNLFLPNRTPEIFPVLPTRRFVRRCRTHL